MTPPKLCHFYQRKHIPAAFWLFILDKAHYWDQSPHAIKDDEEVQKEWLDVKQQYKELRTRMLLTFNTYHYVIFFANGNRPIGQGDGKVGPDEKTPTYHTLFDNPIASPPKRQERHLGMPCRCFLR